MKLPCAPRSGVKLVVFRRPRVTWHLTFSNPDSNSSSETGVILEYEAETFVHLTKIDDKKQLVVSISQKKWRAETLQPDLAFDNSKPWLENDILISRLNGSFFFEVMNWWSRFFWKRKSRPIKWHQCRLLTCKRFICLHNSHYSLCHAHSPMLPRVPFDSWCWWWQLFVLVVYACVLVHVFLVVLWIGSNAVLRACTLAAWASLANYLLCLAFEHLRKEIAPGLPHASNETRRGNHAFNFEITPPLCAGVCRLLLGCWTGHWRGVGYHWT